MRFYAKFDVKIQNLQYSFKYLINNKTCIVPMQVLSKNYYLTYLLINPAK